MPHYCFQIILLIIKETRGSYIYTHTYMNYPQSHIKAKESMRDCTQYIETTE